MGSMIKTETFDPGILQALFDAFSELPYTILWKGLSENFSSALKIPGNVYFKKWMPQIDILCTYLLYFRFFLIILKFLGHPKVKLFISHGGLLSSQEAVYCGVPRIGIPLFADQEINIRTSEKLGIAKRLSYGKITKEIVVKTVKEILEDSYYKENVEKISQIFKDRPMSPLDTAVYWVEYVIRHNGAPQLRSVGADLPWYQYFLVDVAVILLFAMFTVLFLIIYVLKFVLHFIYSSHKDKFE